MGDALNANFTKRFPPDVVIHGHLNPPARGGAITVIFGPSGCGKTTLLRCLAGLERPEEGTIRFGAATWFDAEKQICLPPQERGVGFLFQDYALFPHLSVGDNVAYGLSHLPAIERRRRCHEMLARFNLSSLISRRPRQLSGGEQQRVALARALVCRPRLLLLDEPLSALDTVLREELRGALRPLLVACAVPVLVVTHDRSEALALGDELVVMQAGQILQSGPVQEIFHRPANADVARIVRVETLQTGRVVKQQDGLTTVQIGPAQIVAVAPAGSAEEVLVCIRGEDVILQQNGGALSSVRNRLRGRVVALYPGSPLTRVELDVGFPLFALVTRLACEELELRPGAPIDALIKAPAIHLIAR